MLNPSLADQMARLTLWLLEKKLEQEREDMHADPEQPHLLPGLEAPGAEDDALRRARTRRELLQRLWEQRLLEELSSAQARGRTSRSAHGAVTLPDPPSAGIYPNPLEAPRVFHLSAPPAPATIIQQLPQQPLITQLPPAQACAAHRRASVKEDMVELMLMQNAQLHQVLMHSLMLRALPGLPSPLAQDLPQAAARGSWAVERSRPAVHHHHHYAPTTPLQPSPSWPPMVPATTGLVPAVRHLAVPLSATMSPPADSILTTQNPGL